MTGEMVEELILSGADMVKVGIGPGSVCTTRRQTYDLRSAKLLNCFWPAKMASPTSRLWRVLCGSERRLGCVSAGVSVIRSSPP